MRGTERGADGFSGYHKNHYQNWSSCSFSNDLRILLPFSFTNCIHFPSSTCLGLIMVLVAIMCFY